ncbi:unnamed protein product [Penicillium salamii]|nr:unnamed protein product [Penicillium salamii]CAG8286865.1 unnamed protein product [Penicillium salamii]CAG8419972.1 unnamed protein product [Penicillium salamii]CAG8420515.1 unnamed protein product [Penicillium salamii]
MSPTMSVFTIVHRALPPLSLWKRRTSLKGKSPCTEIEISEKNNLPEPNDNGLMHHDVHTVQVAVRGNADEKKTQPSPEDLPEPECRASSSETLPTRAQLARAVSWASIVRSQDRWTAEQEKELVHAQRQLEKCQKAWSSEQEVWLVYVQALSEEKEAHTGFLSARHRQQGDEQHQFRKAWKRRRSSGDEEAQQSDTETANRLGKLRRLQRYSYSGQQLGAGSTALSVKA